LNEGCIPRAAGSSTLHLTLFIPAQHKTKDSGLIFFQAAEFLLAAHSSPTLTCPVLT